jgi:hypothetical protein
LKSGGVNLGQKALAETKKQAKPEGIDMDRKNMGKLLNSLQETAAGLHKISVITDAEMREYE